MQLEPFNHSTRRWDRFREFYNYIDVVNSRSYHYEPFIHLETGEVIITQGYYRPSYRRFYEKFNVGIFNSDDFRWSSQLKNKRLTTPDGDEVKMSWLNNRGAQHLWFDDATQVVVAMHHATHDKVDKRIPARLRNNALVYYPAPNEQPIGASSISVTQVDKLNDDEKAHVRNIVAACKAWNTLSEEAQVPQDAYTNTWPHHPTTYSNGSWIANPYYYAKGPAPVSALLLRDFATMPWAERKQVAMNGILSRRKTTTFTHLKLISQ